MICPFCDNQTLVVISTASGIVERCPSCMGFFVSWDMLAHFSSDPAAFIATLNAGLPLLFPTGRICPHCYGRLFQGRLPGLDSIVSLCVACKLFWTDPADLENFDPLMAQALRTQLEKPTVAVTRQAPQPDPPATVEEFSKNPGQAQSSLPPTSAAVNPADVENHKQALEKDLREAWEKREADLMRQHAEEMKKARDTLDQTLRKKVSATESEQTQQLASLQKNMADLEKGRADQEALLRELKTRLEAAESQRAHLPETLGKRDEDLIRRHSEEIQKNQQEFDKILHEKIGAAKEDYADFIETLQKYILGLEQTKIGQEKDIKELKNRLENVEKQRIAPSASQVTPPVNLPTPTPTPQAVVQPKAPVEQPIPPQRLPEIPKTVPPVEKPAAVPKPVPEIPQPAASPSAAVSDAAEKKSLPPSPKSSVPKKPSLWKTFWAPTPKKPVIPTITPEKKVNLPVEKPSIVPAAEVPKPVNPEPISASPAPEKKPAPAADKPKGPKKPALWTRFSDSLKAAWSPSSKKPVIVAVKPPVTPEKIIASPVIQPATPPVPAPVVVVKDVPPVQPPPQSVPTPAPVAAAVPVPKEAVVVQPLPKPVPVKTKKDTAWLNLIIVWTPRILPAFVFLIAGNVEEDWGEAALWAAAAWAVSVMIRLWRTYPSKFKETTLADLTALPTAALKGGIPVQLKGRLDMENLRSNKLVFNDGTGSLPLNLLGRLDILPRLFGLMSASQFPKDEFELKGWYRRSKKPFIETAEARQEKTLRKSLVKPLRWTGAVVVLFFAVLLLFVIE